ncbi:MAG: VOC family protein, partial [Oscillospiraceae bacterium]|nr:VOC family protein [Oscillospiraceae bacterium]
ADAGMGEVPPNFVMHSEIELFGTVCAFSDGVETPVSSEHHCFTIVLDTDEEVKKVWDKLIDGGTIVDRLEPQFWTSLYGYVKDKFGVNWSVNARA